jgi:hypothetical protein
MARDSYARADSEVNAEVEAALSALNASTSTADDELLENLTKKIATYSQLKDKAKFEDALMEIHEELVRQIALKHEAQREAQRSSKKIEISGLRFQKDLLQKAREVEEGKDMVTKLKSEISTFKSFTSEGESTM